tara:strand:- start:66 stop:449 length:384 start_codon:yes stop_codon:yes gene_type:complete
MAKNYTFSASLSCSATTATGYTQSQDGAFTLNLTNIDQIDMGRKEITTSGVTVAAAPTFGKVVYMRNLDSENYVSVFQGDATTDPIGIIEPGEFLFTIVRDTELIRADANTATVTVEYFVVEIDSAA